MSWASPGQRRIVYVLVALCALGVRFGFWSQIRGTALDEWHTWDQSDMATYVEQARRLSAGDWLARDPYHPYHAWQSGAASEAEWLRWYGPQSFHQAPLYSYALAALAKLHRDYVPWAKALQLALGALTCVLVARIAGRIGGIAVALVAGGITACYGPLYYQEAQLLREGPAVCAFLLVLLATLRHVEQPRTAPLRQIAMSAGWIGLAIGLYSLLHETAVVLGAGAAVVLALHAGAPTLRRPAAVLAALLVGYLAGVAPLVARNAAIGAPLATSGSRLAINLVQCNMASAPDGGATFFPPTPHLKEIMDASGGSLWGVARELWNGYEGHHADLFRNWAHRSRVIWSAIEIPDNTSFHFFRRHSSILNASLSFRWIFPAALAVWLAWLVERTTARVAPDSGEFHLDSWFAGRFAVHGTLLLFALLFALGMSINPPQSRYRLFVVPVFAIYTSLALVGAARLLAARRFATLGVLTLATAAFAAFHAWVSEVRADGDDRYVDYTVASEIYRRRGNEAAAAQYRMRRIVLPGRDAGSDPQ